MSISYKTTVKVSFSGTPEEVLAELEKAVIQIRGRLDEPYVMLTEKSLCDRAFLPRLILDIASNLA